MIKTTTRKYCLTIIKLMRTFSLKKKNYGHSKWTIYWLQTIRILKFWIKRVDMNFFQHLFQGQLPKIVQSGLSCFSWKMRMKISPSKYPWVCKSVKIKREIKIYFWSSCSLCSKMENKLLITLTSMLAWPNKYLRSTFSFKMIWKIVKFVLMILKGLK